MAVKMPLANITPLFIAVKYDHGHSTIIFDRHDSSETFEVALFLNEDEMYIPLVSAYKRAGQKHEVY